MNIFNWTKLQIKEALEFEDACLKLQALLPKPNDKRMREIKIIAKKVSKFTPENPADIIEYLCNYIIYPDLLEKEIEKLEKIIKQSNTS